MRHTIWMRDIGFAWRTLRKSPGLLVVAALSLGLGIALNTTVFTVVYSLLFRVPAVDEPRRLVNVYTEKAENGDLNPNSVLDFQDLRTASRTFEGLAAHCLAILNLDLQGRPTPLIGSLVSANYFEVLGVQAARGSVFSDEHALGGAASPAVVITDAFWRGELEGRETIIGETVRLSGQPFTVLGVLPPGFSGLLRGFNPKLFVPLAQIESTEPMGEIVSDGRSQGLGFLEWRGLRFLTVTGRLAEGTTLDEASAELSTLQANLATQYPATNQERRARLLPTSSVRFDPDFDSMVVPAALLVLALAAMVLLVACANIGNLLLAKAQGRRREIAVRLSLGATRSQLVRLLLVESLMLSLLAGAIGLVMASGLARSLNGLRLDLPIQPGWDLRIDTNVVLFTLFVSLVTGIAFGLLPALQASRKQLVPALREESGTRGVDARGLSAWLQPARLLVLSQVALSLVLLVGSSLLQRSVHAARAADLGFDADRLALLTVDLSPLGLEGEDLAAQWEQLLTTMRQTPGVEQASVATRLPLDFNVHTSDFFIPGHRESEDEPPLYLDVTSTDREYFSALDVDLVEGSWFTAPAVGEASEETPAEAITPVIINQAMAQRFWPNQSALGKVVRRQTADGPLATVVGVVENYKVRTPGESPRAMAHFDRRRNTRAYGNLLVRTAGAANDSVDEARSRLQSAHPDVLVLDASTLSRRRDLILLPIRAGGFLVTCLGGLALLLAVVGLAGLVTYSVSRRTREIGLRVALGADGSNLAKMVLGSSMSIVAVGAAIGLGGALALGRLLQAVLYVPSADPLSLLLGVTLLLSAAAIASLVPLRRAMRVDPLTALREG